MPSEIRDIALAESGEQKIEWVKRHCDLLRTLMEEFEQTKPFAGKKIALSVHLGSEDRIPLPDTCSRRCRNVRDRFQSVIHTG